MPCPNEDHAHDWPVSGELIIEKCERFCGYCTGPAAEHCWKYPWFLRRHVRNVHKRDFPNVTVSENWYIDHHGYYTDVNQIRNQAQQNANANKTEVGSRKKAAVATERTASTLSEAKSTVARKIDGAPARRSVGRPLGVPNKKPLQRRNKKTQVEASPSDDRIEARPRISSSQGAAMHHHGRDDDSSSLSLDDSSVIAGPTGTTMQASIYVAPIAPLPATAGRQALSPDSLRSFSTISRSDSVLIGILEPPSTTHDHDGATLRIPLVPPPSDHKSELTLNRHFAVEGISQVDPAQRHFQMLNLKLSFRNELRALGNKGLKAGLYSSEVGLIFADEVDHYFGNSSGRNSFASSTSSNARSAGAGVSGQFAHDAQGSRPALDLPAGDTNKVQVTVDKIKLQALSARLDQQFWTGYGDLFMHDLFGSTPGQDSKDCSSKQDPAAFGATMPRAFAMGHPAGEVLRRQALGPHQLGRLSSGSATESLNFSDASRRSSGMSTSFVDLVARNDDHAVRPEMIHIGGQPGTSDDRRDSALSVNISHAHDYKGQVMPRSPTPYHLSHVTRMEDSGLSALAATASRPSRRPAKQVYDSSLRESANWEEDRMPRRQSNDPSGNDIAGQHGRGDLPLQPIHDCNANGCPSITISHMTDGNKNGSVMAQAVDGTYHGIDENREASSFFADRTLPALPGIVPGFASPGLFHAVPSCRHGHQRGPYGYASPALGVSRVGSPAELHPGHYSFRPLPDYRAAEGADEAEH